MYTASVCASFSAIHRVALADGTLEPEHGHDWEVRAQFAAENLNERGMVVDFAAARAALAAIAERLHHGDLNDHEWFRSRTPTAENVARVIFDELRRRGIGLVRRVEVTEAPGCRAAYES